MRNHLVGTAELDLTNLPSLDPNGIEAIAAKDAEVHYCLLEIPLEQSKATVPPSLHPSVPGLFAMLHFHCKGSNLGAFDLLLTGVICRSAAKHRLLTVSAFTNNPKAQACFEKGWGFSLSEADIKLSISHHLVLSSVRMGGEPVLEVVTNDPIALSGPGATVRYAQALNPAKTVDGIKLVQVDVSYDFKRVARGVPKVLVYRNAAMNDAHPAPRYPVSGTLATADISFDPVKYLADLAVTAEAGGIALLSSFNSEAAA